MSRKDPTRDEMQEFLRGTYGDQIDEFELQEAIHWFASDWHGGQWSNLYSALSTSQFKPSPLDKGPAENAIELYDALEDEYC